MSFRSTFARWWVNMWPHRWRLSKHVPQFLRSCPEPFRGEVLELGAGYGWTTRKILETFPQVELTAIDSDPEAVVSFTQLERQFGRRLNVRQANAFQLPFDRESFDIVIGINIFPQLKPYSLRKGIAESLRVLRPGGLLGINDWTLVLPRHDIRRKTIEEILAQESCEILYASGENAYTIWARKPYPISPEDIATQKS